MSNSVMRGLLFPDPRPESMGSIYHVYTITCVVTRTARVPRRPAFKGAIHGAIDVAPFFQWIRFGMVSTKPCEKKKNVLPRRNQHLSCSVMIYYMDGIKREHYRSATVLPSLRSQYTAPTVMPSPHGLPPKGRHDTFVMVFHEYLKQVKFKWHGCVCIAIGQFAPVGL
jgi:hypothetical protein